MGTERTLPTPVSVCQPSGDHGRSARHRLPHHCHASDQKGGADAQSGTHRVQTPTDRRVALTWAQRLNQVFNIDIDTCSTCGDAVKVIACIEDPVVIKKILTHLKEKAASAKPDLIPEGRAPPQARPGCLADSKETNQPKLLLLTAEAAGHLSA